MNVLQTNTPAKEAARILREKITAHESTSICFLSGGSALPVVSELNLDADQKRRTIFVMGDERWSREKSENNYLQLIELLSGQTEELTVIKTVPEADEDYNQFARRIDSELKNIFENHSDVQTIALLGIGTDGHTASIFPMDKESFTKTYPADSTYVPVQVEGLTSQYRASIAPAFLHTVDHILGYATGDSKKMILESLLNESKDLHEMPSQLIKLHKSSTLVTDQEFAS